MDKKIREYLFLPGLQPEFWSEAFTMLELLLAVGIIVVLSAVVLLIINPIEIIRRGRDTTRIQDLSSLTTAINTALHDSTAGGSGVLCFGTSVPCSADSNDPSPDIRSNNGSGWVKVNFASAATLTIPTLPIDPINDDAFYYSYFSDGTTYELNARLESAAQISKMETDGGNNAAVYETGTGLTLIN